MTIEALYIHTLTISRPTRTSDGQGGWSVGYVDVATIEGRLRPKGASERTVAQQGQAEVSHVLYCGPDSDIQRGDLVTGAGKVVEVVAIREPSHMGHHLEVDCTEIQKAGEESGS
ncbi:MAG: head-tail adaptor protein [Pseudomonadota bacterium]